MGKSEAENTGVMSPSLIKDVDFKDQLNLVKSSISTRTTTRSALVKVWNEVRESFGEYGVTLPIKRMSESPYDKLSGISIRRKRVVSSDKLAIKLFNDNHGSIASYIDSIAQNVSVMAALEEEYPGIAKTFNEVRTLYDARYHSDEKDEEKTKVAVAKVTKVLQQYDALLAVLDETGDTIVGVKEYIDVVEKLASISAVANGGKK